MVPGVGGPPWVEDHGGNRRRPAGMAALVAGRAGMDAVDTGRARPDRDALAEPAGAPGRPVRPGVGRQHRHLRAGRGERGHGRGSAGHPPPSPPSGLAAARLGVVVHLRLCQLGAAGLAWGATRRWPRGLGRQRREFPACIGFILLLTPSGSLPSPRWRWWARGVVSGQSSGNSAPTARPRPVRRPTGSSGRASSMSTCHLCTAWPDVPD
jgi:hypothetical protein